MTQKEREVIAALRNGEKLRVGYFNGLKALYDDGDVVEAKVIRSLKTKGLIGTTRDGFVVLLSQGPKQAGGWYENDMDRF